MRRTRSRSSASCARSRKARASRRSRSQVHPRVLALLAGPGGSPARGPRGGGSPSLLPRARSRQRPRPSRPLRGARARASSTRCGRPPRCEEGATIELKLVEVGLHDPTAAWASSTAATRSSSPGRAKLVGKKVKATVGARRSRARRTRRLADDGVAAPTPITFEAEAEKPTRASRGKKDAPVDGADESTSRRGRRRDGDEEDEPPSSTQVEPEATIPTGRRRRSGRAAERAEAAGARSRDCRARPKATLDAPGRQRPTGAADPRSAGRSRDSARRSGRRPRPPRRRLLPGRADGAEGDVGLRRSAETEAFASGLARRQKAAASRPPMATGDTAPAGDDSRWRRRRPTIGAPEYVPMSEWIDDFETALARIAAIMRRFCGPSARRRETA